MDTLIIMAIACLVSIAAALPGCFLILRRMAMMSDAISHSVLLGIVLMFFVVKNIHSPLLMVAASLTGILTVYLTEWLISSRRMKKDAAIGLVFPLFFALAIILISQYAGAIHLDQDAVILGEIAFAPFNRLHIWGMDVGPAGLWSMGIITIINYLFVTLFYKELMISTFDPLLAKSLGFPPKWLHYGLMTCVSITCVGAFDIVGTILIVALIVTPPASAYLITDDLSKMIPISMIIGCACAILGTVLAIAIDGSISGTICSLAGIVFLMVFLFSPRHGWIQKWYDRHQQKIRFSAILLTIHGLHHVSYNQNPFEYSLHHLTDHMRWDESFAKKVMGYALAKNYIVMVAPDHYELTDYGKEVAKNAMIST